MAASAELVLGPILRYVGETTATVWVETDRACTVDVLGFREPTWRVRDHHYALVVVKGLPPGSTTAYDVHLDGHVVWPVESPQHPPSVIRTLRPGQPVRLAFGSCRYATLDAVRGDTKFDYDALEALAARTATVPVEERPDALLLLGDQVYADETSESTKAWLRSRRDVTQAPYEQVADFEEYTRLYRESWSGPHVRWLLSTVPTAMIFDDHDVHDDWNTSGVWRDEMQATSWWRERIVGGLSSYWVYQHLGNLAPGDLATDEVYRKVREADDAEQVLRDFAAYADSEADGAKGARWSYRRDFGRVRLIVVDSRAGRVLGDGLRCMVDEEEFSWIEAQADEGSYDHLLIGTSLPWLLPRALHDIESWNESLCSGVRGQRVARLAERMRRGVDLEHWAAFRDSFDRLARLLGRVGDPDREPLSEGLPPATICVLSGDVHHAYVAEAIYPSRVDSRVYQVTVSPLHNYVPRPMQWGFRLGWSRVAERVMRFAMDRVARVEPPPVEWVRRSGPFFGNELGSLRLDGRTAELVVERTGKPGTPPHELSEVMRFTLC
jgi:hypothetical protein